MNRIKIGNIRLVCNHSYRQKSIRAYIAPNNSILSGPGKRFSPTPFAYHHEIEIRIDDLTNLGVGVGRIKLEDGSSWVVMVGKALPGELVTAKIYRNHSNYSEADLVSVLSPSPDRVSPKCKHFDQCGGCQYQHFTIEGQRKWKRLQVSSLLARIGKFSNLTVNEVVGTSQHYAYRSKITPHYDKPASIDALKIGFLQLGSRRIVDIEECSIATRAINMKYAEVRDAIVRSFESGLPQRGATLLFRDLASTSAPASASSTTVVCDQRQLVVQEVEGVMFRFKAGEFFQTNIFILPLLVQHVMSMSSSHGCSRMIDAYCGSGLFSLTAADQFESVHGVEINDIAVNTAFQNAVANEIRNVEFYCSTSEGIFKHVAHLARDRTVVVMDPPRKGCDAAFLEQLINFRPKKIVYVSCDPATQARDALIIATAGYEVIDVTPFDMFPQTRHIENVITFLLAEQLPPHHIHTQSQKN